MEKNYNLFLCAYGNEKGEEKGIVKLTYNTLNNKLSKDFLIAINGKANMVVENKGYVYVSEQRKDGNFLVVYDKENGNKLEEIESKYFYSYGCFKDNRLYLASFSDGVDSVYDFLKKEFIAINVHEDGTCSKGRSHFIDFINDKMLVSVDNALQKVYFYKNSMLEVEKTLSFDEINVRLLSIHPNLSYAYLNTEISNEVIVLNLDTKEIVNRVKVTCYDGFSGGNAINENGSLLAVSIRGEDKNYIYRIKDGHILELKKDFKCGAIPRDLRIKDDLLFVTCTNENSVEIYDLVTFNKLASVNVNQPITFGI